MIWSLAITGSNEAVAGDGFSPTELGRNSLEVVKRTLGAPGVMVRL